MTEGRIQRSQRIPVALHHRLEDEAAVRNCSINELINALCEERLDEIQALNAV